jgi:hypothetical protein
MGHADISTTMAYSHHVEKHDAAARFTEFVREQASDGAGFGTRLVHVPKPEVQESLR